jgi:hypothetical protein
LLEFHTSVYYFNFSFKDMRLLREGLIEDLGMNKLIMILATTSYTNGYKNEKELMKRIDVKTQENKSCPILTEGRSWDDGRVSFSPSNSYSSSCLGSLIKKHRKMKINK